MFCFCQSGINIIKKPCFTSTTRVNVSAFEDEHSLRNDKMESKRRRLAPVQQTNSKPSAVVPWLPIKTTFCKQLPLSGEGVVSVNIKRRTTFAIRIRPAPQPTCDNKMQTEEEADEEGYVEVEISTREAILKAKRPYFDVETGPHTEPSGGLEKGKKVSLLCCCCC